MPTLEVFTFGGGQYLLAVFNAVAAWTGAGGYASMLRVAMVLGLILSTLVVAFNLNWRAWVNWFLTATLIYLGLMVPKVEVIITDRVQSSLPIGNVANVPLGLGLLASFTSQIGDYLTTASETVFGMPNDIRYENNGMIYAARLYESTQRLRIRDPEFATNLDEHFRQCVYYDVLLGFKSLDTLASAPDVWAAIGPGSPARSQKFLTREPGGTVSSDIITCQAAYTALDGQWAAMIDQLSGPFAQNLYPRRTAALAKSKLISDLPISYEWLVGVSSDATDIFRQNLAMNAMEQAMYSMAGSTGSAALDVYATTRMQTQTRNTYAMIGENAMKWVPLLHIVLTVLFYAMFPIIFPLFLFPYTGVSALKSYSFGFFYLAAWGPLFVVLNMILMWKARDEGLAAANASGGVTLATFSGMQDITSDVGILAGYLIASVPFLAAGIAKGALSIAGQATSFLAPSQAAASQAGVEASTGSFSLGTTSFDNASSNNRQVSQWNLQPSYSDGFARQSSFGADGTSTTRFGSSTVVDQSPAISRLAIAPQLNQALSSSFSRSAAEAEARSSGLQNRAEQSFASAFDRFTDFRSSVSQGNTLDSAFGAGQSSTIRETFGMLDQAAQGLSQRFGISMEAAQRAASEFMFSGTLSSGLFGTGAGGGFGQGAGGVPPSGAGVRSSLSKSTGESTSRSDSVQLGEMRDFLEQVSRSQGWDRQADAFNKASVSSSRSDVQQAAQGVASRYSEAESLSRAATESWERTRRYEELASLTSTSGASVGQDLSQEFVEYVLREQSRLPGGLNASAWNPTRGLPRTAQEVAEKDFWVDSFIGQINKEIESGAESRLIRPTPAGIVAPSANSQVGIEKAADENGRRVPGVPEGGTAVPLLSPDDLRLRRAGIDANVDAARESPAISGRLEKGRATADGVQTTVRQGVGGAIEAQRKRVREQGLGSALGGAVGTRLGLPGSRDRDND
jgi:conjugal transfer mating pair stabilization protein TraG